MESIYIIRERLSYGNIYNNLLRLSLNDQQIIINNKISQLFTNYIVKDKVNASHSQITIPTLHERPASTGQSGRHKILYNIYYNHKYARKEVWLLRRKASKGPRYSEHSCLNNSDPTLLDGRWRYMKIVSAYPRFFPTFCVSA